MRPGAAPAAMVRDAALRAALTTRRELLQGTTNQAPHPEELRAAKRLEGSAFREGRELAGAGGVAQLFERLGLDLPDTLAGDPEGLADFGERVVVGAADAEAHAQDVLLARGQAGQRLAQDARQGARFDHRMGVDAVRRRDQLAQGRVAVLADPQAERYRPPPHPPHLL